MPDLDVRALEVVDTPLAKLRPWGRNPRTITAARLEQLKAMIAASPEMLQARPLIALLDGTVIAGNQRLAAVQALGWESVPAVFVDLDEAEAVEWAFRDNNPAGETDPDLAAELLAELGARGRPLDMTGFAPVELTSLLRRVAPEVDPDAVPPVPARPRSKRGAVYELGPHRLMCGDATSGEDMGLLMGDDLAAMVFTDPPYGVDYDGGAKKRLKLAGDERHTSIYANSLPLMVAHAAPRAAFYVWYADLSVTAAAAAAAGLRVRCQIVWAKNHAQFMSAAHYHGKHEPMLYAGRGGESPLWYGPKNEVTLWEYDRASVNDLHPTQKPTAIIERALANSSLPGDVVLDPFAGSGSSVVASEALGRRCFAMEIDPAYCDVIRQRYADYVGDQKWAP